MRARTKEQSLYCPGDNYGSTEISERHRHRYEFANEYRDHLTGAGLILSGTSPDQKLVEIVELADHPWFVGCQFHPELQSRPTRPHPLFAAFVAASATRRRAEARTTTAQALVEAAD